MKLTIETFLSLDGVMQAPGGPEEDPSGGFEHGGWSYPYADEEAGKAIDGWFQAADAFLLGRRTYEIFAGYWPKVTDEDNPIATKLNSLPKHVASRTLDKVDWNNSALLDGDAADAVAKLKGEPGNELQVHGSGNLAQTLMKQGLIDEYRLFSYPVVIGSGKRLFADGAVPAALKLVDSKTTGTGIVINTYQPAGPLEYGEVGLEDG